MSDIPIKNDYFAGVSVGAALAGAAVASAFNSFLVVSKSDVNADSTMYTFFVSLSM